MSPTAVAKLLSERRSVKHRVLRELDQMIADEQRRAQLEYDHRYMKVDGREG